MPYVAAGQALVARAAEGPVAGQGARGRDWVLPGRSGVTEAARGGAPGSWGVSGRAAPATAVAACAIGAGGSGAAPHGWRQGQGESGRTGDTE